MSIPLAKVFWPLTITASNQKIDMDNGAGANIKVATIATGVYLSAVLLAAAVQTAMNAVGFGGTWTISVTSVGKFVFVNDTNDFRLLFSTGVNVANSARNLLGFFNVDINSTAKSLTAPSQHQNGWYSLTAVKTDSKDFFEEPNSVVTVCMGGQVKSIAEVVLTYRVVDFHFITPDRVRILDEDPAHLYTAMERWWTSGRGRFRYWPDASVEATSGDYFLDSDVITNGFVPERMFSGKEVYHVGPWKFRKYNA